MAKHPVNFTAQDAKQAANKLNDFVEKGGYQFDIGVNEEYVNTVSRNSDGSTRTEKEKVFRIIGFVDCKEGPELDEYTKVKDERKALKKEREELDRKLKLLNGKAFGPLSIFLMCVGLFCLFFGIMTIARVLPLPEEQKGIAIALIIVGALAAAGCVLATVFRSKKVKALQANRPEIEKADASLKERESSVDSKTPAWYKDALWEAKGDLLINKTAQFTLRK